MSDRLGIVALALTALAFALRVSSLTAQSVWNDEAGSLWHASFPVSAIVAGLEPDHLPLYFLLLKGWVALAGASDFAARYFSLMASVATVPLIWWLARRVTTGLAGATAAVVAAVSPSALYYGQEIRMYALMPPLVIVTLGSFLNGVAGRRRWWLAHAAALVAVTHLHYFGALTIFVSWALAVGWVVFVGRGRWLLKWTAAQIAVLVLTAPYLLFRFGAASGYQSASAGDLTLAAAAWRGAVGLLLGHHLERVTAVVREGLATTDHLTAAKLLIPMLVVLALGLIPSRGKGWFVAATALAVPTALIAIPLMTGRDFVSRYLIVVAPALWLLLGLGVARLSRWWWPLGVAGLAAVGVPTAWSLLLYHQADYARDDFRAAAAYVAAHVEPGDVVLMNAGYAARAFNHYFVGGAPVAALPAETPPDDRRLEAATVEAAADARRVWLVLWQDYYSDPRGVVRGRLERDGVEIDSQAFHGLKLARYLRLSPFEPRERPTFSQRADFDGEVRLLGYDLTVDPADDPDRRTGVVRVRLYWQALRPLVTSYRVFVQLVNPVYHVYAAKDNRPSDDRFPTTSWPVGTTITDEYRLVLLPGTPPGEYRLSVGIYDEVTGQRRMVDGTERTDVLLGPVRLDRSGGRPNPEHLSLVRFDAAAELLGYDLGGAFTPGVPVRLTLHWRALMPPPDLTVFVHLVDAAGTLMAQRDSQPAAGGYPTSRWRSGEYIRDFYDLDLPSTLPAGSYELRVGLYRPDGERLPARPGNPDRSATIATVAVGQ